MFSSFLCCLLLPCLVWSVLPSNATTPILVTVQTLKGISRGVCPSESQLVEAKQQLKTTVSSALDDFSRYANSVSSCDDLPSTSATGYYWISSAGTPPAMEMFCDFTATNPLSSCSDLPPRSPGGYYWTLPSTGPPAVQRYCNRTTPRGCSEDGSWTRVGFLNMSDPDHTCPENWELSASPRRTCGTGLSSAGCSSLILPTSAVPYTHVCGRIVAYHNGASDGFDFRKNLELAYLDGLSLTHGSPGARQHVWSFVAAAGEAGFHSSLICSCSNGADWNLTPFVGNDYFCDTGNHGTAYNSSLLNYNDPLWDGEGCGLVSTCCHFNSPPWFQVSLAQPTTNDLEIRNCQAYQPNYDSLVELIEIYVQ